MSLNNDGNKFMIKGANKYFTEDLVCRYLESLATHLKHKSMFAFSNVLFGVDITFISAEICKICWRYQQKII